MRETHRATADVIDAVGVTYRGAAPRRGLLRRAPRARRARRRGAPAGRAGDGVDAGRRADRRQLGGLRRGAQGLRPSARHRRGGGVRGTGASTSTSGWRRGSTGSPSTAAARHRSSCRTRATCATCSGPTCRSAHGARPRRRRGRARRRRPVLWRRWGLLGAPAGARRRDPRAQARRHPPRRRALRCDGRRQRQPRVRDAPRRPPA